MRWWTREQEQTLTIRNSPRRLSEVSGTGTLDSPSEGDDMASKRGSNPIGDESQSQHESLHRNSPSTDTQFLNNKCQFCNHLKPMHFIDTDEIGSWSFCILSTCDCFLDMRSNDS
jgi:hypothetical protein